MWLITDRFYNSDPLLSRLPDGANKRLLYVLYILTVGQRNYQELLFLLASILHLLAQQRILTYQLPPLYLSIQMK